MSDDAKKILLARRARFVAAAIAGLSMGCGKEAAPHPCLDVAPEQDGAPAQPPAPCLTVAPPQPPPPEPQPCLSVYVPRDAGTPPKRDAGKI